NPHGTFTYTEWHQKGIGRFTKSSHMSIASSVHEQEVPVNAVHASSSRMHTLSALALAVLTGALYAQTTQFDFVNYDDHVYVTQNPKVLGGLSVANVLDDFQATRGANWHPLTWLSLQWDATWWPLFDKEMRRPAAGYHLTNVVLHTLNAL